MLENYYRPAVEQIEEIIQHYGKDFAQALVDEAVLGKQPNFTTPYHSEKLRKLLLKHKLIKRSTKIIKACHNSALQGYFFRVTNGNGRSLVHIRIRDEELPEVAKVLNNH